MDGFSIPKVWQIMKHFTKDNFIKHKSLISEELRIFVRLYATFLACLRAIWFGKKSYLVEMTFKKGSIYL